MNSSSKLTGQANTALVDSSTDESNSESDCNDYDDENAQEELHNFEEEETEQISDNMSMEELLSIQEKIGTKAFSRQIMKTKKVMAKSNKQLMSYKRANKNRPTELPLQRVPAPRMKYIDPQNPTMKPSIIRDPRFDDLSGKLDIVAWKKNYKFIGDKRKKEIKVLKKSLKREKDPEKLTKIKLTMQRMQNQEREHSKRDEEHEMKKQEREAIISSFKEGKAPRYMSKKEKYLSMKLKQFNQLDKKKFNKYVERKEKKLLKKDKI